MLYYKWEEGEGVGGRLHHYTSIDYMHQDTIDTRDIGFVKS